MTPQNHRHDDDAEDLQNERDADEGSNAILDL
jgi:hypothetical protein